VSRIGRMPVTIPAGVKIKISGQEVTVEGSKGKLTREFHPDITVKQEEDKLVVTRSSDARQQRSLHGLSRSLLANMVEGVTKGFEKNLELSGVGYRAQKTGTKLTLQVGYSHPVEFDPPKGIDITIEGTNKIRIMGVDKELVGETAAEIKRVRVPDSYKGKGIKYAGEKLRLKPGKAGKTAAKGK
jgi:large subunit ribosomal protein L6